MKIIVVGSGMMGQAIAYDLCKYSHGNGIAIADRDRQTLQSAKKFLEEKEIKFHAVAAEKIDDVKDLFKNYDVAISAVPYRFNYNLAKIAIETKTHFLDLGGNNEIVQLEKQLHRHAQDEGVTVIPDCGLAPGLTSIITRDIVETMDPVDFVKIRVGGLPVDPKPPLMYQMVFSPYGLINEYVEDVLVLDHGKILRKKPMTALEKIEFPQPFGTLEAFLTSGGCSTLPYTYKNIIGYLDYKTIRYPGHCEKFKFLLELGFTGNEEIIIDDKKIIPRDVLAALLMKHLPSNKKDVVLLRVLSKGIKNNKHVSIEYSMIDSYDEKHKITAMMRTTAFPASIIAQMIVDGTIAKHGVFCPEEIIPCAPFFAALEKRDICIQKQMRNHCLKTR
jgi:lysine 6-dehydrogenase